MAKETKVPKVLLNQALRGEILERVCKHRFSKDIAELEAAEDALARKVWAALHTPEEQEVLQKFPHMFGFRNSVHMLSSGDRQCTVYFANDRSTGRRKEMPVSYNYGRYETIKKASSTKLQAEYERLWLADRTLKEDTAKARAQTEATLEAFKTIDDLVEAWPEIKPFVPEINRKQNRALPVVQVEVLNTLLKLPA